MAQHSTVLSIRVSVHNAVDDCLLRRRLERLANKCAILRLQKEGSLIKFGVFYEHQLPRPWSDGAELRLFQDALEQVELARSAWFRSPVWRR
jgi:hypothetical protein